MKNNWYVLTGAPSSGKTTLLKAIAKKGYNVHYEQARIYIDSEIKKGRSIKEIRNDELAFQRKILELKINFEKSLTPKTLLFMERGIPDSIAYMKLCGITKDAVLDQGIKKASYRKVFLLELFKYEVDYARTESQEEAILLEELLERSYKECNIKVIRVPRMSVKKRLDFILKNVQI